MDKRKARRLIEGWERDLRYREAAPATVEKYVRETRHLLDFLIAKKLPLNRDAVLAYKAELTARRAPAGANAAIAAVNGFVRFVGKPELVLRHLRVQPSPRAATRELTAQDYERLVRTANARGMEQEALIVQTLAATGIRVSELSSVTVEVVRAETATVTNKGRTRRVWLPSRLCSMLRSFARRRGITAGPIFVTRRGRALDRTRIWRILKRLAAFAGIAAERVFPHALRHLFATMFQRKYHDLDELAGILGHARVETTRVYLAADDVLCKSRVAQLGLV